MDLGPALLLVIAGIGFETRRRCHLWRFQAETREWDRTLLESAFTGLLLFGVARLVAVGLSRLHWKLPGQGVVKAALPFEFSGTLVLTLLLGITCAHLLNRIISRRQALLRVLRDSADELRRHLHECAHHGVPVMLTMADGKVYVGLVLTAPHLGARKAFVRLLPTLSGFRRPNQTVEFTTNYATVYGALAEPAGAPGHGSPTLEDFAVVIPLDGIVSARRFDDETYRRHFASAP